jgi:transposase-like protein
MSILSAPYFHNEKSAYKFVESHLWPNGPTCPRCGEYKRVSAMGGKSTRIGTYKCYSCRKPFTVKIGTIFESSHIQMRDWLAAIYLMSSSKKGISTNQLSRTLGLTLKSAWFMSHRIREAMRTGSLGAPMGAGGGTVEIDETFIGRKKGVVVREGTPLHKHAVLSLVSREDGQVRSFHVDEATRASVMPIIRANISKEARVITDEAARYKALGQEFADHQAVAHMNKEYARGDVTTNTVEGFFSVFKRGMRGVYQHCSERHLHRYLAEFDHRYSNRVGLGVNDKERAARILRGVKGKRLTYKATGRSRSEARDENPPPF